jgi:hypothetical protein
MQPCGTHITYAPNEKWEPKALDCPNCGMTLIRAEAESKNRYEFAVIANLSAALKFHGNHGNEFKFQLRLEFDQPK